MAEFDDWYNEKTILKGDECSKILAEITSPSLKEHPEARFVKSGMNHVAVLVPRENHSYFAFTIGGPAEEKDTKMYVKKLLKNGVDIALDAGLEPLGFTDVIDANRSEPDLARMIGNILAEESHTYSRKLGHGFGCFNGEYADLSTMIKFDANMNITIIGRRKENELGMRSADKKIVLRDGLEAFKFIPGDKFIYMNSDGEGSKSILEVLAGKEVYSVINSDAMKADDLVKINAEVILLSDLVEHNGLMNAKLRNQFKSMAETIFAIKVRSDRGKGIVTIHDVGDRLNSYSEGMLAFNVSGSAVSLISEKNLANMPVPKEGDYLLSIRKLLANSSELSDDGWRSNGISPLRKIPLDAFGKEWYKTAQGREILRYATTPSDIFYPAFKYLLDNKLASSVFHLSGGAYNGKLARPLMKEGLHAKLYHVDSSDVEYESLWSVSDIVKKVIDLSGLESSSFYNKWVMSNPGFVATDAPAPAALALRKFGYAARVVARLEKSDKPGVTLIAYDGTPLYFDGKDK
jgi:phosphoribosylaminoimidazole (AIR) synthetase